jgi:hypothetical protein
LKPRCRTMQEPAYSFRGKSGEFGHPTFMRRNIFFDPPNPPFDSGARHPTNALHRPVGAGWAKRQGGTPTRRRDSPKSKDPHLAKATPPLWPPDRLSLR